MAIIEIRSRWDSSKVLFSVDTETLRQAVEAAVKDGADLRDANLRDANLRDADLYDANLRGADLYGADLYDANLRGADLRFADLRDANLGGADLCDANLRGADLRFADLRGADLRDADLRDANLYGADLYGANLRFADLRGADLRDANLRGADLYDANLRGADLYGADLRDANLRDANLRFADLYDANLGGADLCDAKNVPQNILAPYRDDIRKVLDTAPNEVYGLLQALWDGKVDGSTYTGECACLVGTLEKVRGKGSNVEIPNLEHNSSRPAEQWFLNIHKGDTPVTNPSAAFACAVIAEWAHEKGIVLAPVTLPTKDAG
jgi:uncharacterized protein YjbI with pentapeptide repeats